MMSNATDAMHSVSVLDSERRALTIGILLTVLAFATEGMGVVPALPTAVRAMSGLRFFGWVFSAFMLAWVVGTVAAGQMADKWGPYRPMALGLLAFAGGLLLAAASLGMRQFLAARVLQGLGGGAMVAASYVAIARGYTDALRARMMALTSSAWIVPAMVAPLASGIVAERFGWRWVFAGIVPMLMFAAVLVLPALRPFDLQRPATAPSRTPAALRLAIGMGLILGAVDLRTIRLELSLLSGAVGVLLLFPALNSLLPPGTLRGKRGLPMGLGLRGLLVFGFFGSESFIPLAAGDLRSVSSARAGLALTAGTLGWIVASWVQERLDMQGGSEGRTARLRSGFGILTVGIVLMAITLLSNLPFLLLPIGWAIAGFGIGLSHNTGTLLCMAAAPSGQEGEVSGQLQLIDALGTAAGAGAGGALLTLVGQFGLSERFLYAVFFLCTSLVPLCGALLAARAAVLPAAKPAKSTSEQT